MSFVAITFPAEAAGPVVQGLIAAARPLIGLSLGATLVMLFKPLLAGLLRAALLLVAPRPNHAQKRAAERLRGALLLHRLARDFQPSQPEQAAELRRLASRG